MKWLPWKLYRFFKIFVSNFTKIWLEPGTQIGKDFHIIHGSGFLAVHPGAVIGDRCGVMHNVTIGVNMSGGVPRIGDDVFIGANATLLGPIVVGDRVRIGANALVLTDVPADSIVQAPPPKIFPNVSAMLKKGRGNSTANKADGETF
ncbi:serine acetyltransferase [Ruegeria sp. R13_0]|uniref:serine O-acetyltransferase n=1 Tax=Ruegeria sp. R13_0 TaxID=2821099 RepID=UPI001ADBF0BF|nr:serine acetyltransferase [Ruegeria sp. R13_0]MBO9436781.1 serine acetyltransferase [Ruegeria sp. R13_0]